jgi:hypothetical protein
VSLYFYLNYKAGGTLSMVLKLTASILLLIQAYLYSLTAEIANEQGLPSHLGNILEYTLSFTILGFVLILGYDVRGLKMGYVLRK